MGIVSFPCAGRMPTLYVLIGVSGSGKSTYAESLCQNTKLAVVSTDKIREQLFGSESDQREGDKVFKTAYDWVEYWIENGKDVVFDATNTTKRGRKQLLRSIRYPCIKVAVLFTPPIDVSIARNANRQRIVPESVIRRQYEQLIRDGESIPNQFDDVIFVR